MRALDLVIILVFLIGMPLLGVAIGGRQKSADDYFVSETKISWWVVCLSVVSAETSTLTVLSVPAVAYVATPGAGGMTYLTLAFGYIIGRIIVSFVLLPKYIAGDLVTAYAFLGKRFGNGMQATASMTFQITRLLADGIRLFATAIPIKVVLAAYGVNASYWAIVIVLGIAMVFYSFFGGVRAVVWVDAIQMLWYLLGGLAVIVVLASKLPDGWFGKAVDANKFQMIDLDSNVFTGSYPFLIAFFGGCGAVDGLARRRPADRAAADGDQGRQGQPEGPDRQWFRGHPAVRVVPVHRRDDVGLLRRARPGEGPGLQQQRRVVRPVHRQRDAQWPVRLRDRGHPGRRPQLVAGRAGLGDRDRRLGADQQAQARRRGAAAAGPDLDDRVGGLLIISAGLFATANAKTTDPIVVQALGIAGYTYGALLGAFLLGLIFKKARQFDAIVAFVVTVVVMAFVILGVKFVGAVPADPKAALPNWDHITIDFGSAQPKANIKSITGWWNTPFGVAITLIVGGLLSLRHSTVAPEAPKDDDQENAESAA